MSAVPRTLWLHGDDRRIKNAVLTVVSRTTLQDALSSPAPADYRKSFTLQAPMHRMSSGEELLFAVCHSLAGHGSVMLTELVNVTDADSVAAVADALLILAGLASVDMRDEPEPVDGAP